MHTRAGEAGLGEDPGPGGRTVSGNHNKVIGAVLDADVGDMRSEP